ncbi:hypothetical protein MRX96_056324 [Rhipicephalus microplus]
MWASTATVSQTDSSPQSTCRISLLLRPEKRPIEGKKSSMPTTGTAVVPVKMEYSGSRAVLPYVLSFLSSRY